MFEGFPDSPSWGYENDPPPPDSKWFEVLIFLAFILGIGLVVYNFFVGGFS